MTYLDKRRGPQTLKCSKISQMTMRSMHNDTSRKAPGATDPEMIQNKSKASGASEGIAKQNQLSRRDNIMIIIPFTRFCQATYVVALGQHTGPKKEKLNTTAGK